MSARPVNTSLEDPIINYCKQFWQAVLDGDLNQLQYYWKVIWRRREQLELSGVAPRYWDQLYHAMTQQFPAHTFDIAMLVSQITHNEKVDLQITNYYKECESRHKQSQQRGKIRLLPQASNNPYIIN